MGLIVQKYGGTSVADLGRIENVAKKVIKTKEAGHDVVVVLSAMAGETDRLIQLVHQITDDPQGREYDALIATGEQITAALLSIMLNKMGYRAKSFLGFQVKVLTEKAHKKARIKLIDTAEMEKELKQIGRAHV